MEGAISVFALNMQWCFKVPTQRFVFWNWDFGECQETQKRVPKPLNMLWDQSWDVVSCGLYCSYTATPKKFFYGFYRAVSDTVYIFHLCFHCKGSLELIVVISLLCFIEM